ARRAPAAARERLEPAFEAPLAPEAPDEDEHFEGAEDEDGEDAAEAEDEEDEAPTRRARASRKPAKPAKGRGKRRYQLPDVALLAAPKASDRFAPSQDSIQENAQSLESVLQDFGVRGQIINARPGP